MLRCGLFCLIRRRPPRTTLTEHPFHAATRFRSTDRSARGVAGLMAARIAAQGDRAEVEAAGDAVLVRQTGWRLMSGLGPLPPSVFDGWNGLWQGMLDVHDRFLARSEEHTSELQSLMRISYAVFCLKQKKPKPNPYSSLLQSQQTE